MFCWTNNTYSWVINTEQAHKARSVPKGSKDIIPPHSKFQSYTKDNKKKERKAQIAPLKADNSGRSRVAHGVQPTFPPS